MRISLRTIFPIALLISVFALQAEAATPIQPTLIPKTTEYHLKNGLTIIVRENHRAPVAVLQMWYKVGSVDELPGKTGLSHALEHMMFEGSKNYPGHTFDNIATSMGAKYNAETGTDYTDYYAETTPENLPTIMALEADRMANLQVNAEAFHKQMEVVKEERRMRIENNPQAQMDERFGHMAFPGNPNQHPSIGWMRDINHFTVADVQKWHDTWYAPNNATMVVVGDVNPEVIKQQAEKYFGSIPAKKLPDALPFNEDVPDLAERNLIMKLPAKLPLLEMGYNVPSLKTAENPKDAYALYVLSAILSSGNSSRMMVDLIHGQKIASSATSDSGLLSRYSNVFTIIGIPAQGHTLQELQKSILEEIGKFQTTLVTPEELQRVKIGIETSHIYSQDSIVSQANTLGTLAVLGLPWQLSDQFIEKIEAVTPADIQAVAKKYFVPERLTVAMLYPLPMKTDTPVPSTSTTGAGVK